MSIFTKAKSVISRINLQLFGEGGDGGTAGADGAESGVAVGVPSQQGDGQPLNVMSDQDRRAAFNEMRKGEFKAEFDAWAKDTIQQRLKGTRETVDRYNALTPTLEMLADKYGVDVGDINALNEAIQEDDSFYEDEAIERGVTVKQLKEIKAMERENAQLRAREANAEAQRRAEQEVGVWMRQAEEAARSFPDLDLRSELQNPDFVGLLKSGIDVGTAYFAVHHQELIPQAMQYAAKETQQKVVNSVRQNGVRPLENGNRSLAPATVNRNVSQLTKAQMAEINARVEKGETIRIEDLF